MKLVCLLTLVLSAFTVMNADNDLLILHCEASSTIIELENNIGSNPFYGSVDYWNGSSSGQGLATLQTLQQYDCVFTWNDLQYTTGQGDALADYVDGGGTVVLLGWGIAQCHGRILDDAAYCPIAGGSNNHQSVNMGTTYTHPILADVNSITGIYYRVGTSLEAGATLIAEDTIGEPLVAINSEGTVVAINMVAGDYIRWTGDGWVLFNNAIQYLMTTNSLSRSTWAEIKSSF